MTSRMERICLADVCTPCHVLQCPVGTTESWGISEHFCICLTVGRVFGQPLQGFLARRYDGWLLGFLHGWEVKHPPGTCRFDVSPFQSYHVTVAQACETTEHEGLLGYRTSCPHLCQSVQFGNSQGLTLAWCLAELITRFQCIHRIPCQCSCSDGTSQHRVEHCEISTIAFRKRRNSDSVPFFSMLSTASPADMTSLQ